MPTDKPEVIGARLKALREALGHPKAATFCRFIGILDQAWNNYEHGRRRIGIDEAMKVVIKTGVSLDWIYRGLEDTLPVHIAEKLRLKAESDRAADRDWRDLTPAKKRT